MEKKKKLFSKLLLGTILADIHKVMKQFKYYVLHLQKDVVKSLYASILIGAGVLLVVYGGFWYLFETLGLSKNLGYLFLGIIFVVLGMFVKNSVLEKLQ